VIFGLLVFTNRVFLREVGHGREVMGLVQRLEFAASSFFD